MKPAKYRRGDFVPFYPAQEGLVWDGQPEGTPLLADDCTRAVRWLSMFATPPVPHSGGRWNSRDATRAANEWFVRNGHDLQVSHGAVIKAAFDVGYTIRVARLAQDCTFCMELSPEDFPK